MRAIAKYKIGQNLLRIRDKRKYEIVEVRYSTWEGNIIYVLHSIIDGFVEQASYFERDVLQSFVLFYDLKSEWESDFEFS